MIINHNLNAMNAHRMMMGNTQSAGKAMEKLSSGLRINRAGDDAAGLAISEKMRGQIRGLDQAGRNAQDGISLLQTAEGALNETHSILQRMRELAVQSSNDTNTEDDRKEIQKEMNQLTSEINRISTTTEFNTQNVIDGTYSGKKLQIGANQSQQFTVDISDMSSLATKVSSSTSTGTVDVSTLDADKTGNATYTNEALTDKADKAGTKTVYALDVTDATKATNAITVIDYAIKTVSSERSKLGAFQNRLEHTVANLGTSSENLSAAESRVRDVDMAKEMMTFSKNNILSQAAQAMLAQANQQPQGVLQLLR